MANSFKWLLVGGACLGSVFVSGTIYADENIEFKPIGRLITSWTGGSNADDQIEFDEVTFNGIDLGGMVTFPSKIKVRVHTAFNDDSFRFKGTYLEVPIGKIKYRIGQNKVPNFFNWQFSSTSRSFIERPTMRRAFGAGTKFGVTAYTVGEQWGWVAGVYKGDLSEKIGTSDWTLAARGYMGLSSDNTNWFLGASARYRGNHAEDLSYGDRPYTRAVGKLAKYEGGTSDKLVAGEVAFQHGALFGVGEGAFLQAKSAIERGETDGLFAGYAEIGYNLTGEETKFDFRRGSFGRIKVANPVGSGGWGMWQVAARYDVLDVRAGNATLGTLNGGLQKSWVFALNWQPSKHVRLLANYSRSKVSHRLGSDERISAFGMRLLLLL